MATQPSTGLKPIVAYLSYLAHHLCQATVRDITLTQLLDETSSGPSLLPPAELLDRLGLWWVGSAVSFRPQTIN